MHQLQFKDGGVFAVADLPSECPRCHRSIAPVRQESYARLPNGIQIVFQCPGCHNLFITSYQATGAFLRVQASEPLQHEEEDFGNLDTLSPQFGHVFNQAAAAEASGLTEIAGLGYRKSLEFLIKDYCVAKDPAAGEAIKAEFLGTVIKNRVGDRKIKLAAEKVAWLGNDEAHYIRKWETHDIEDLKKLLSIAVSGIKEDIEFEELMASFDKNQAP